MLWVYDLHSLSLSHAHSLARNAHFPQHPFIYELDTRPYPRPTYTVMRIRRTLWPVHPYMHLLQISDEDGMNSVVECPFKSCSSSPTSPTNSSNSTYAAAAAAVSSAAASAPPLPSSLPSLPNGHQSSGHGHNACWNIALVSGLTGKVIQDDVLSS